MKTIHLIRHADAAGGSPDIERPLSNQGVAVCTAMAPRIWDGGCHFAQTFVSPAVRAQSTARGFSEALAEHEITWSTDTHLYTFEWPALLKWLESHDEADDDVTVVGHNPAVSELTEFLTGEPIAQAPTCAYLCIDAYVSRWRDLYRECGQLAKCIYPVG